MEKKHIWRAALIGALVGALIASFLLGSLGLILYSHTDNAKLRMIWSMIDSRFYKEASYEEAREMAEDYAAAGMVYSLNDVYSEYITAEDFKELQDSLSGTYYGVGITISYLAETGYVTVVATPFYGSPAAKAGLQSGDCLIAVDDLLITEETMDAAVSYMRTPKEDGTPLHLTWLRDGVEMSADITPTDVVMNSVNVARYQDIAYIQLTGFDELTVDALHQALIGIDKSNTKGLILDLRDNPGGILEVAVAVCDTFLGEGTVMYTQDKYREKEIYTSDKEYFDIPMVVLVNNGSASASEITAGALKDHNRATIIGETTFGKGVVQGIYPLWDGSAVKLTISRYFTPNGVCIDGSGIEPDEVVSLPEGIGSFNPMDFDLSTDTQMKRAIEILREN